MEEYTGREIALFTDAHGLLEPVVAIVEDAHRRGIYDIKSLGDNIGVGPSPKEVLNYMEDNGVESLAGNSEEYITLGTEPFSSYFNPSKQASADWTKSQLGEREIGYISIFPRSYELLMGGEKIALCHFANDVRSDFGRNSTWSYQKNYISYGRGARQFLYTNSYNQLDRLNEKIEKMGSDSPYARGIKSTLEEPLFGGKPVTEFDAIFQGHVHFKMFEQAGNTKYYTLRAVGMGYSNRDLGYSDPIDSAYYIILHEKTGNRGYDVEEVRVPYDREAMLDRIRNSDSPDHNIERFVGMRR